MTSLESVDREDLRRQLGMTTAPREEPTPAVRWRLGSHASAQPGRDVMVTIWAEGAGPAGEGGRRVGDRLITCLPRPLAEKVVAVANGPDGAKFARTAEIAFRGTSTEVAETVLTWGTT